ncbi:SRPBCC family protein [Salinarimonas ramus]|uniref:Polyketide cyclase n=1 Tax=Salinarimonas ramus TaxID=690164 RepID=A0A917Q4D6_9HYPH|nr:SRPBCC family protein [Salinarimonas ramus]GGK20914.1 polyketide cyclase [Salinarimonas ramus]
MAKVYVSAVIDAPIEEAWAVLRDFNALPRYHRFFARSEIEDGLPSDRIGCVRNFHTHDGGHIRERLLTLSDREHRCCYEIIEATLPVRNYVAEMTLKPITESGRTFGEWWAEYDVAEADAAEVHRTVTDTFRFAFEGAEDVVHGRAVRR